MKQTIPGPQGSWLLGNLSEFKAGMLPFFERCHREYGQVVLFRLGRRRLILVSDPSLIEAVLVTRNKSFHKHFATRLLTPVLGRGLLLSEGEFWLRQRRLIQPAFSRSFATGFADIVHTYAAQMTEEWRQCSQRDLYLDMTRLTVRIAAHAFLGVSGAEQIEVIGDCLELIHSDFERRFQQPWNLPVGIPTRRNRQLRRAVQDLTAVIDRMVESCRLDVGDRHDALSLLLKARDESGQPMPQQLLRDEVMTLLLAGHDTTANALTWTWTLLAQHPDVMRQLFDESATIRAMNQCKTPCLEQLPLATQVIKESMRLFPPVYVFGRQAIQSITLGGYQIRKGDTVLMPQWVVHRDPEFYDRPEEFVPARWTPEFEQSLPPYAYFPFGGGPRVCIGKGVSMIEAAVVLATLAAEFQVVLSDPEEVVPWPTVTLRPRSAVRATVISRHNGTTSSESLGDLSTASS